MKPRNIFYLLLSTLMLLLAVGATWARDSSDKRAVPGLVRYPLTERQKDLIFDIRRDAQRDIQEVRTNNDLTLEQKRIRVERIRRIEHDRIMNVLTTDQKREFSSWWRGKSGTRGAISPGYGRGMRKGVDDDRDDIKHKPKPASKSNSRDHGKKLGTGHKK